MVKDVGEKPSVTMFRFAEDTLELNDWSKQAVTRFWEDPAGYWVEVVPDHSDASC